MLRSTSKACCEWSKRGYSTLPESTTVPMPSSALPTPSSPAETLEHQKSLVKQVRKSDWKRRQEGSNFVDTLSVNLFSGKGGSGGVAFHREKFKAKGPPSGGPGGQGGSVYLLASSSVTSLSHLPRMIRAGAGASGLGKWLGGKRGEDIILRVPLGTIVREVRWEIEGEVEKDREEREQMEWAWDASKVRLAEAERREKRWDAWKKRKDQAEKDGEETEAYVELETAEVEECKQQALEKIRRSLFIMYPQTELASHPSFLNSEHLLLSKLLSRQAANSPRKTRRRRSAVPEDEDLPLLLDLVKPTSLGDPILLLAGGAPGLGNPSFQSADDRSPKYATRGAEGEMMRLELEVKSGGEVGLVGQPNAGKSTILRALTSSTPRVAAYPFTTLNPHHGTCVLYSDGTFSGPREAGIINDTSNVVEHFSGTSSPTTRASKRPLDDPSAPTKIYKSEIMRFTMTDNPGLVPLSSLNVGLGHSFLRHIERCAALVYVVDLSRPDPVQALEEVRKELREYARMNDLGTELEGRIKGVVANKADLFGEAVAEEDADGEEDPSTRSTTEEGRRKLEELSRYVRAIEQEEIAEGIRLPGDRIWIVPTSAKRRENVVALVDKLAETVRIERKRTAVKLQEAEEREEMEREEAIDHMLVE